jgi:hypothetical protein
MAAPTTSFATYNQVGIREDLSDVIYDISPMDTYFFSHIKKTKATNTLHDWQTDALEAPVSTNQRVEGDDFSAGAINPTTKLRNYTEIVRKDFVVTRTSNIVNTAGRKQELAYQVVKKGKALKRDIEKAMLSGNGSTAGSSVSARVSTGVETWIYVANHIHTNQTGGTTPAPVGGLASDPGTDGTATAFVEADLKLALQQAWSCGGEVDVILLGPTLKAKLDAFTGIATRFRNVNSGQQAEIIGAADVYVSDFGSHKVMLSRYMRASAVLCLDMGTWAVAWLDQIHMENIAKSGDSEKRMIVGEYTLEARSPTANTKLTNVT